MRFYSESYKDSRLTALHRHLVDAIKAKYENTLVKLINIKIQYESFT